jgi:hypothetical protein
MKKLLLASTALAVTTGGAAQAEVKFSGSAEAGFFRTASSAAVAVVTGDSGGVWTYHATTGVLITSTATALATAASILLAGAVVDVRTEDLRLLNVDLATSKSLIFATTALRSSTGSIAIYNATRNIVGTSEIALALAEASYADQLGTAAVAAVTVGDMTAYSGYDFNVGMSTTSDSGMTFSTSFDMGAGSLADTTDDLALEAQDAAIGASSVTVGMNGYTLEIGQDQIDDLYDDSQNGDFSLSGALGALTFQVVMDNEKDTAEVAAVNGKSSGSSTATGTISTVAYSPNSYIAATAATAAVWQSTSYTVGATIEGVTLSATGTDKNDNGNSALKVKGAYTMGAITVSATGDNQGELADLTTVGLAYAGDQGSITASSQSTNDWDFSGTLKAGSFAATYVTDEANLWNANVSTDLGGGASAFAYTDSTELVMAGVKFNF